MDMNFSKNIGLSVQKQPNPSRNLLVEAVLLLIVCVLFVIFIVLPKRTEVNERQKVLTDLEGQAATVKSQVATLNKLVSTLEANKDLVAELDKALPLELNMPELEILLNSMAKSVNVTVASFGLAGKPSAVAAGDKELLANPFKATRTLQKISGGITVTGNFDQLKAFIEKLESSGRLINISELQMDAATEGTLNLRMNLNIYFFGV